ncbi:PepSY-associated TM helix domain-containing protein [Kordiimonas pumila]|uniref:PepSY-associated TM helix domain-containing protein n=1 Tax=Kordiimonas pumila TaxID=2161677 RepID=A0ABV7D568_9PROT|nr:PepSY-associated TM helix domain-containing protein [Kordiimonas pumila]
MQKKVFTVHKWVGLSAAAFLLLQAVTGLALVYRADILHMAGAGISVAEVPVLESEERALETTIDLIANQYPKWSVRRIDFPASPGAPYVGRMITDTGAAGFLMVRPELGTVSEQNFADRALQFVFDLHVDLLAGQAGAYFIGIMGIILVVGIVTGIIIAWPGFKRLKRSLKVTFKNTTRTLFELHRSAGMVSLVVIFLLAFTGIFLIFGSKIKPFLGVTSPKAIAVQEGEVALPNAQLLKLAKEAIPFAKVRNVRFTSGAVLNRVVFYHSTLGATAPASQVWINPVTGAVTAQKQASDMSFVEAFFAWMYPLHVDFALGRFGQLLSFLGGLVITLLTITGPILWWRRYQIRKPKVHRAKGAGNA